MQRNTAVVGENAFVHSSGIHQDGMIKASLRAHLNAINRLME